MCVEKIHQFFQLMETKQSTLSQQSAEIPRCYHCHEVCSSVAIQSDEKMFCCDGCKFVYELLRDNNLCTYYSLEEQANISLKHIETGIRRPRFDYLEDITVQHQLLHFVRTDLANVSLYLPQIHCASCLWLLEKLHKFHVGIVSSRIDFMAKTLSITFQSESISLRNIVELLTTLGYEPELRLVHLGNNNARTITPQQKSLYIKLGIAGFAFGNTMIFSFPEYITDVGTLHNNLRGFFGMMSVLLALPVLVYSASDYFRSAWVGVRRKHITLDIPIVIGILALFIRSVIEIASGATSGYLDSFCGLVFLLLCGKLFQQKTFDTIAFDRDYTSYFPIAVTTLQPDPLTKQVHETSVPLANLRVGTTMLLRNNELVPADAVLLSPLGHIDYSFVTGESAPVEVLKGTEIFAGGRVTGQAVQLLVTKEVSQSYLTSLWNNESFTRHRHTVLERVSDLFGAYFTIFVIILALGAFVWWYPDMLMAVNAMTAVLIIACPCAMTLASPFALGWAMKIVGRLGLYVKNASVIMEMTTIDTVVFDKTGTLTTGTKGRVTFKAVSDAHILDDTESLSSEEEQWIISALRNSVHPLSRAIVSSLRQLRSHDSANTTLYQEYDDVQGYTEIPGQGIMCRVAEHEILLGSASFVGHGCSAVSVDATGKTMVRTVQGAQVHIAIDGRYRGVFILTDELRSGMDELLIRLQSFYTTYLMSGDNDTDRSALQALFPPPHQMAFFQSPHNKLDAVKDLQQHGAHVMMVGDGLNDAGALKVSHVGIAVTEHDGAFSPACSATIAADSLQYIDIFLRFARYTRRVIIGAFWISVVYNIVGLSYAVMGAISPLFSAVLMPMSNITVIGFTTLAMNVGGKIYFRSVYEQHKILSKHQAETVQNISPMSADSHSSMILAAKA